MEKGDKKKKRERGGGWGPGGKVTKGMRELNHAVLVLDQAFIAFMTITHEPKLTHQHPAREEQEREKEKNEEKKKNKTRTQICLSEIIGKRGNCETSTDK